LDNSRAAQLIALFDRALDVPRDQRTEFVERVCADDSALRQELSSLVEAHESAPDYFDHLAREVVSPAYAAMIAGDGSADAASELRDQLQEAFGDEYAIERELSGAGMSRVFLADEPRLARKVVIKVVRPGLLPGVSAERFAREIRLAASLQQANIVPVLAAGTAAGLPYYTMPFIDGRSLSDRLAADGALPIPDAMSVLRDVLRALAHAHARGVVHRDIKPGNVLLSGGTAVVTDFGIARALGAAAEPRDGDALTQPGAAIGTPAYMAPEQATGDPSADHRADIYAFGCLAYAVFTGRPPFDLDAPHRIIAAHFNAAPSRLTTRRSDVPPAVAALIARCLEKDPARRPQSAIDLLESFDAEFVRLGSSATQRAWLRPMIVGALVVISLSAIAAYTTRWIHGAAPHSTTKAMRASQTVSGTTNAAALDLYLVGRELMKRRGSGINQSVTNFERAIALDSSFAPAYAALATALELYPYFVGTPPSEVRDRAVEAARHALALDSMLAEPHTALGWVHAHRGVWDSAHAEFRRAIQLSPRDAAAHFNYGRFLLVRGEANDAVAQLEDALIADPTSSLNSAWIAYAFLLQGKADSALAESARAVQLDSTLLPTRNLGALVNLGLGRDSVARRLMAVAGPVGDMSLASYVYARLGDTANVRRLVRALDAVEPRPWFRDVALATVALAEGDTSRALDALERSWKGTGSMWFVYLPVRDAAFDPVRATSRFAALARRAGLDVNGIPTPLVQVPVRVP
jgi:tetratricopeptide (TPR) repeat protein